MNSVERQSAIELAVFEEFRKKTALPIVPGSVTKHSGESEPDITCALEGEGAVAFELTEICEDTLAANLSALLKGRGEIVLSVSDPSSSIARKKLRKNYRTEYPLELLCYTNARVVATDDMIVASLQRQLDAQKGPYRRVWLLGEKALYEVWHAS
jgi:hypothetical protein